MTAASGQPLPPPGRPRSLTHLQAFDDAMNYRHARLAIYCPDCRPGTRCDDHACDIRLLQAYRRMRLAAGATVDSTGHEAATAAVRRLPQGTTGEASPAAAPATSR